MVDTRLSNWALANQRGCVQALAVLAYRLVQVFGFCFPARQ